MCAVETEIYLELDFPNNFVRFGGDDDYFLRPTYFPEWNLVCFAALRFKSATVFHNELKQIYALSRRLFPT
jgi:hypothetical protein